MCYTLADIYLSNFCTSNYGKWVVQTYLFFFFLINNKKLKKHPHCRLNIDQMFYLIRRFNLQLQNVTP